MFEIHKRHVAWCKDMAASYRIDAILAPEPCKTHWLKRAKELEEQSIWFAEHTRRLEEYYEGEIHND